MTIKNLVISGGGPFGFTALGTLQHLEQNGFWKIEDIETIYATSVGAIISILLCLKFEWSTINDYIIKRPWQDVFKINVYQIIELYNKKGLFGKNALIIFYKPFFDSKDISLDITMLEFFNLTGIELHFFTLELNGFEIINVSYLNYPDLSILTAIQMTSSIPILIEPVFIDDKCYIDGGIICNYPISYCIEHVKNTDEILGLCNNVINNDDIKCTNCTNNVTDNSNILEFITKFTKGLINNNQSKTIFPCIQNQIMYENEHMTLENIKNTIYSQENRQKLIDIGIDIAIKFLETIV